MSKHYKHLSKEERDRLAILKGQGHSVRAIAAQLGRSPSTISRKLHRNAACYLRIKNIPRKTAVAFREALVDSLGSYPGHMRMTIIYDNGAENTCHGWIDRALGTASYFCEPYHSWEKGSVEKRLNNRPCKCLNFQAPAEAFRAEFCT